MLLLWIGSITFGLTWGWLIALWTTPPKHPRTAGRSPSGYVRIRSFLRRCPPALRPWFGRAYRALQRVPETGRWIAFVRWARRALLLLLLLSAIPEVWLYGGPGPTLLFVTMAVTGLWLHHSWREYMANQITD